MLRWIGRACEACVFRGSAFSSEKQACIPRPGGIVAEILTQEQLENVLPRMVYAYGLRLLM